jgi:flagellar hook protein FlgE
MGLASALSTALTGLTGSETTIDVVGNNLANSNTVGFKESSVSFAPQFLQTYSLGSAPTATSGGTNPVQVGLGTTVAAITANFSSGTTSATSVKTDMAISGNGFFIIRQNDGSYAYTRDGEFTLNSNNQLVTAGGNRVMGHTVNDSYVLQTASLQPISISLGTKMVAEATHNVSLLGTLSPSGDVADTAKVINTVTLGDDSIDTPAATSASTATAGILSGTYGYYITYYNSTSHQFSDPVAITDGSGSTAITTSNNTVTITLPAASTSTDWDSWAIYRNTNTNKNTFYQVGSSTFASGATTFSDNNSDSTISTNPTLSMIGTGSQITDSTLLTDVIKYNSSTGTYENLFTTGSLNITQSKGSEDLSRSFPITGTSTVGDLLTFYNQSLGIQTGIDIPTSKNVADPTSPYTPGAQLINGQITLVGNNGTGNAVSISSMTMTSGGTTNSVDLQFSTVQDAVGESATTDFTVYDSLGISCGVSVTAVLESKTSSATTYRWFADSPANSVTGSDTVSVGTGVITFDSNGNVVSVQPDTITIYRDGIAASTLQIKLDFFNVSGLAADTSTLTYSSQDGCPAGTLTSYTVSNSGMITGTFSNSAQRTLGQILLARFTNPQGLNQLGNNLFAQSYNSGAAIVGSPGNSGLGTITSGALELSNTDVGANLIDLILASTMYRANTKVISTVQTLFDTLLQLQR